MRSIYCVPALALALFLLNSCIPFHKSDPALSLPAEDQHKGSEAAVDRDIPTPAERPTSGASDWPQTVPDLALIDVLYRPFDLRISDRFITPAVKERIIETYRDRFLRAMPYYSTAQFGTPELPPALNLSGEQWAAIIPDAPLVEYSGACPLCLEPFKGLYANRDEQWTGVTKCCGKTLYSRAEDLPEGSEPVYDATLELPGMNGKVRTFLHPSSPGEGLFLPAGLIATEIHNQLFYRVIPSLTLRVLMFDDAEAAATLAAILDREAEVFSSAPWINIERTDPTGFARYRDVPEMLPSTAKNRAAEFQGDPEAFIRGEDYQQLNQILLDAPIGTIDGTVKPNIMVLGRKHRTTRQGTLAEAWDAIRDRPETQVYSEKTYGDSEGLEKRMLHMLKQQAAFVRHNEFDRGNFVIIEFAGAVPLAVVTRDEPMAQNIVEKMFTHLWNHYFAEGISHEGAFNYSHMMSASFDPIVAQEAFGVDFSIRFPWVNQIYKNWDYPVTTLLNIESTHGDEHAAFFASVNRPAPETVAYDQHEKSQVFPEYGLTCLRAGEPGSRLEVIMSHQNSTMHTDPDRLGIQLFYEGVNLLPDIGYMTDDSLVARAEAEIVQSEFPFLPTPLKKHYDYNDSAEAHCNALINGNQFGLHCTAFERFMGGQGKDEAAYLSQFIQVDGSPVYHEHAEPVEVYNRQLMTINFSNGRPVVFDVFRLRGGRRHDFFWHVPSRPPTSSLGEPTPMGMANLYDYFETYADPKPGWQKEEDPFLRWYTLHNWPYKDDVLKKLVDPVGWVPEKGAAWRFDWEIDPERYNPPLKKGNPEWEAWGRFQHPVNLRLWGITDRADATDRIFGSRGPWKAKLVGFGKLQYGDALSYLVEHRQGTNNLASTFVHLLEPFSSSQQPAVQSIAELQERRLNGSFDGRGMKVHSMEGETAYVATTLNSDTFESDELTMQGRAGLVIPEAVALSLYDGTALAAKGVNLKLEGSVEARLVGLSGDLTAEPRQSSLFIESATPIPTNGILNGHTLTLIPQTGKAHTMGYRIEGVSRMDNGQYRIDLEGRPRFTQYRMTVEKLNPSNPLQVDTDRHNIVSPDRPYLRGRNMYFPRSGFKSKIARTIASGYRAYVHNTWYLADAPPEGAVREGDPVIIYAIQPGDKVIIPSFFACRKSDNATTLSIQSSGQASLTLPASLEFTNMPDGVTTTSINGSTALQIAPGSYQLTAQTAISFLNLNQ